MPNLLTIPTEIRIKILDYAISDITVQELTPAAHSNSWILGRFKNPNFNIGFVCRQLHDESKSQSQRIEKPVLTIRGSWCNTHNEYCVLRDVSIAGMMGHFSATKFEDRFAHSHAIGWTDKDVTHSVRCILEFQLGWPTNYIQIGVTEPRQDQTGLLIALNVVVTPF